jgi:hypothetical protein
MKKILFIAALFLLPSGGNATDITWADKTTGGTFSAADANEVKAAVNSKADSTEIPTAVSDLINDVGYLTGYVESDPLFTAWDKDYADLINKPTITDNQTAAEVSIADIDELFTATSVETALKENRELINAGGGGTGDITGVTAGTGLTGGGDTGAVTLGLSTATSDAITANTAKVSFDSTSSTRLANTSGSNTGDQDLSGYQLITAMEYVDVDGTTIEKASGAGTEASPWLLGVVSGVYQPLLTNPVVQANFGTGVYTFLGTPTAANFFSAVTGEGAFAATLFGYADAAAVLAGIGAQAALTNPIVRADLDTTPADDDTVPPSSGALYDHTTAGTIHVTKISGTSTLGTAEIASGACATTVTTTATGAATTDVISGNFNSSPLAVTGYAASADGSLFIYAWPTANNVNFSVCNNTAAAITPGARTLNWQIIK